MWYFFTVLEVVVSKGRYNYEYIDASSSRNSAEPTHFPVCYCGVCSYFIAATTIGSVAWYNCKRPVGWDKERPDVVPEVKKEETRVLVSRSLKSSCVVLPLN